MSVNDMIKKSVLKSFSQYNVPKMALALLVALIVGIVIYYVYRRFYTGVVYSRSFAVTLVGMSVLTCMVTLSISTNIVISLGMVGALSIVRFRTAIKDSRDTVYIFWTIIVGICCGVGDFIVAGIGSAFVFILFLILGAIKNNNRMLVIIRGNRTKEAQIQAVMYKFFGAKAVLRVKNSTPESIEFIYEITAKLLSQAERKNNIGICDEIYKIGNIEYVNTVMQNDEVSN